MQFRHRTVVCLGLCLSGGVGVQQAVAFKRVSVVGKTNLSRKASRGLCLSCEIKYDGKQLTFGGSGVSQQGEPATIKEQTFSLGEGAAPSISLSLRGTDRFSASDAIVLSLSDQKLPLDALDIGNGKVLIPKLESAFGLARSTINPSEFVALVSAKEKLSVDNSLNLANVHIRAVPKITETGPALTVHVASGLHQGESIEVPLNEDRHKDAREALNSPLVKVKIPSITYRTEPNKDGVPTVLNIKSGTLAGTDLADLSKEFTGELQVEEATVHQTTKVTSRPVPAKLQIIGSSAMLTLGPSNENPTVLQMDVTNWKKSFELPVVENYQALERKNILFKYEAGKNGIHLSVNKPDRAALEATVKEHHLTDLTKEGTQEVYVAEVPELAVEETQDLDKHLNLRAFDIKAQPPGGKVINAKLTKKIPIETEIAVEPTTITDPVSGEDIKHLKVNVAETKANPFERRIDAERYLTLKNAHDETVLTVEPVESLPGKGPVLGGPLVIGHRALNNAQTLRIPIIYFPTGETVAAQATHSDHPVYLTETKPHSGIFQGRVTLDRSGHAREEVVLKAIVKNDTITFERDGKEPAQANAKEAKPTLGVLNIKGSRSKTAYQVAYDIETQNGKIPGRGDIEIAATRDVKSGKETTEMNVLGIPLTVALDTLEYAYIWPENAGRPEKTAK